MSLYKDSKLANILFMKHLSRQVDAELFTVNALSPGY
jgi:NAD(P)-dependent dehydrogenase (short-subunit alcohol dehydrogenase family)